MTSGSQANWQASLRLGSPERDCFEARPDRARKSETRRHGIAFRPGVNVASVVFEHVQEIPQFLTRWPWQPSEMINRAPKNYIDGTRMALRSENGSCSVVSWHLETIK